MNRASYLVNLRNGPSAISKNMSRSYSAAVALTPTVKERIDEVFTAGFHHLGGAGGGAHSCRGGAIFSGWFMAVGEPAVICCGLADHIRWRRRVVGPTSIL